MKSFLIILDGWGYGKIKKADAIAQAHTPFFNSLKAKYPNNTLTTFGEEVGLPEGQMGNSEVGHLNIGAGRIVWQELARINKSVREKEFFQNPVLKAAFQKAKKEGKAVHFLGLVSDGGVHSHINHLKALCDMAAAEGVEKSYIHAFTDGRDCDPKSGAGYLADVQQHIEKLPTKIATVTGRYYAMDRDNRWERVKLSYDALVHGTGENVTDVVATMKEEYAKDTTDEFIKPLIVKGVDGKIKADDVVVFFNFRTDRPRELTEVLSQNDKPEYGMKALPLYYVTMTSYDATFKNIHVVFEKDDIKMTMGELLAKRKKSQLRIAETEKYPHVTFFFSGGREKPFKKENRIVVPSPKVATYDLQPEMSAGGITENVLREIKEKQPDFICLNFANTDMVGHTGDFEAAKVAAQTVDNCLAQIVPAALEKDYAMIIIADHGNSDFMINKNGTPNTAHTLNPVPCILVKNGLQGNERLRKGCLADVAPTLLSLMGLRKAKEMTGRNLLYRSRAKKTNSAL